MSGALLPLAIICGSAAIFLLLKVLRSIGKPSRRIQDRLDRN